MVQLYLQDNQGVDYTNEDFRFIISSKSVPEIPTKTLVQEKIPYGRKKVTYRKEYENRQIQIKIFFKVDNTDELMAEVSKLNKILANEVVIRFDDFPYIYYCNLIGEISQEEIVRHNKYFTLTFETTTPYRYSNITSITDIDYSWEWNVAMGDYFGYIKPVYSINQNTDVIVRNFGNVNALPIVKITGSCDSISIGKLTYNTSITDNLYIDCENYICYRENNGVKENKLNNLSGDWIELLSGDNNISIVGTNLNCTVEIIYRHTYL